MSATQSAGPPATPHAQPLPGVVGTLDNPVSDPRLDRVSQNPIFQTLVRERNRYALVLTVAMLVVFLGFIGLIAFDRALLATKIVARPRSGSFSASASSWRPSSSPAYTSHAPTRGSTPWPPNSPGASPDEPPYHSR